MGWVQNEIVFQEDGYDDSDDYLTVDTTHNHVRFRVNTGTTIIVPKKDLDPLITFLTNAKG